METKRLSSEQAFQQIKETRLQQLIDGGLLRRPDAHSILCGFTDTVRRTLRTLSQSVEREIVVLAVLAYISLL